jgi:hypothetical protein
MTAAGTPNGEERRIPHPLFLADALGGRWLFRGALVAVGAVVDRAVRPQPDRLAGPAAIGTARRPSG